MALSTLGLSVGVRGRACSSEMPSRSQQRRKCFDLYGGPRSATSISGTMTGCCMWAFRRVSRSAKRYPGWHQPVSALDVGFSVWMCAARSNDLREKKRQVGAVGVEVEVCGEDGAGAGVYGHGQLGPHRAPFGVYHEEIGARRVDLDPLAGPVRLRAAKRRGRRHRPASPRRCFSECAGARA